MWLNQFPFVASRSVRILSLSLSSLCVFGGRFCRLIARAQSWAADQLGNQATGQSDKLAKWPTGNW